MNVTVEEIHGWIREQTDLGPRRCGSAAGIANEELLSGKLRAWGYGVSSEPLDVVAWEPGNSRLGEMRIFPIPYCPPGQVHGQLLWLNHAAVFGNPDCRGKIVVCDIEFPKLSADALRKIAVHVWDRNESLRGFEHPATWIRIGWHLYQYAARRGAVGFVGVLKDQPGPSEAMYAPYGFREADILDKPLPGGWLHKRHRAAVRKLASGGATVELHVASNSTPAVSHNIVGTLKGQDPESLLLASHHDSPFVSPIEDASGVAAVLAVAKHFADKRSLRKTLHVCFTAGHFYGSIGTIGLIKSHPHWFAQDLALAVWVEHLAQAAQEDESGGLLATAESEPAGIFVNLNNALIDLVRRAAESADVDRAMMLPAESPLGNYPPTDGGDVYLTGTPLVNYIASPVYLLTDEDRRHDWLDDRRLESIPRFVVDVLQRADRLSRSQLATRHRPARRAVMTALRKIKQWQTTWLGWRPLH